VATINLTVLERGALPLHASAFIHEGRGVVVTGWSKGGKTEAVLAFMTRGASFVGDEWVYVQPECAMVHGIPEPLRLWDWQLRQLPELRGRLRRADRVRLDALKAATGALHRGRGPRRLDALLSGQLHADVPPHELFPRERVALSGPFDRLFLVGSWDQDRIEARPIEPAVVAARMAFSLQHEREPLMRVYEQFRFAFPDLRNPVLDDAGQRERALLNQVLAGKAAYAVDHPYPVDLAALFDVMAPLC
jgi:hypothetical protein